ncbi:MAG: glutamate 5-kinase [Kiritimatiellae bacterium]|nr:glutamate 5-kinase [Kiritimatiellia bacterium]MBR1837420.1 glutamate 5-kinase [Kiritimatiellia bacterium]
MKKVPASESGGEKFRQTLPESRRIVVKIGSRVLVGAGGRPDRRRIASLVGQIAALHRDGREVVLVSSGAIASGMEALGLAKRPDSVPDLQMCAAVGQVRLMSIYHDLFGREKVLAAQLLLTHDDFERRLSVANMRRTLDHLLRAGAVPVVNENDAVADEEVKAYMSLGDNDHLASLVARQIRADLLVMLSAVDGLRRPLPGGRTARVRFAGSIDRKLMALVRPPEAGSVSKGGMDSKLRAAAACVQAGCNVVVADGRRAGVLLDVLAGADVGTLFPAVPV